MAYVVAVTLVAKSGAEARLAGILDRLAPLTQAEPGCLNYYTHRSVDDPRCFFVYERFVDEAAHRADEASAHFQQYVLGEALGLLERSERVFYDAL